LVKKLRGSRTFWTSYRIGLFPRIDDFDLVFLSLSFIVGSAAFDLASRIWKLCFRFIPSSLTLSSNVILNTVTHSRIGRKIVMSLRWVEQSLAGGHFCRNSSAINSGRTDFGMIDFACRMIISRRMLSDDFIMDFLSYWPFSLYRWFWSGYGGPFFVTFIVGSSAFDVASRIWKLCFRFIPISLTLSSNVILDTVTHSRIGHKIVMSLRWVE
jgi:hypothetical protein